MAVVVRRARCAMRLPAPPSVGTACLPVGRAGRSNVSCLRTHTDKYTDKYCLTGNLKSDIQ